MNKCNIQHVFIITVLCFAYITLFVKANTCYRLTVVSVILTNREFSPLNVSFSYLGLQSSFAGLAVENFKYQEVGLYVSL